MLRLNPHPTFVATVPLTVPGSAEPVSIEITFRHKTRKQFAAWWETVSDKTDVDNLTHLIDSWNGPADDAGEPVPFSRDALEKLADAYPVSALEILRAYQRELFESRIKN